jgi:MFS family permease
MPYQPSDTLRSRTFIGLLIAQFLAAFNDQAIHASAMFFAINTKSLTEAQAISLMPILFYAPWALFCTLAGYFADRYSKRQALVLWKLSEIIITLVALLGFWLGSVHHNPIGPWLVLSTVFLMGTHSAFFVPAKYGAMPEILQPHLLSKGNGLLESLSFLAVILGTVSGGILSFYFLHREYLIGVILLVLAVIGSVASLLIHKMPAANPDRPFPPYLYGPLWNNIRLLLGSRALALTVLGIAFFTFVVAFMRATVYMLGESQVPRWTEFKTSVIVGMSALGIGLGSPLAGYLSGGKVELGLVPLGALGMIVATVVAAFTLHWLPGLIACIILIGFFTGFFIVPLFTLLQHRAPKTSKGDSIATSNFINVTGAILASVLFYLVVFAAHRLGAAPEVRQVPLWQGELVELDLSDAEHGRPSRVVVRTAEGLQEIRSRPRRQIEVEADLIDVLGAPQPGSPIQVSAYRMEATRFRPFAVTYYKVRLADMAAAPVYDNEELPPYLFVGAGVMTLLAILLLCRQMPDLPVRTLIWLRWLGRQRLQVVGMHNLPGTGPLVLATNADNFDRCMQVVATADRYVRYVWLRGPDSADPPGLVGRLARRANLAEVPAGEPAPAAWDRAVAAAAHALRQGNLAGLTADGPRPAAEVDKFLEELRARTPFQVVPVYIGNGPILNGRSRVRVVIGHALPATTAAEEIRQAIRTLGDWLHETERRGIKPTTVLIPGARVAH